MVVIVTRPASNGQRLFERIVEHGYHALWWPAFDIGAAPDTGRARQMLARLADYQLAIFVSAHAVRGARALLEGAWPAGTLIGAVGASTRAAIEAELQPDPSLIVTTPEDDQPSGSEAFWRAWQATGHRARRVLILRAEDGRSWLSDRFSEHGAEVEPIAVYTRHSHVLTPGEVEQLSQLIADDKRAAIIFSSTEAVAALDQQVDSRARAWLRKGTAVACHPRIADQLLTNGYKRVVGATFDDDSIIAKLESIESQA
ncbi:MAG: uroporphyrinogen-III synthase [Burkholderiaceae bacterium]|nr:uroporphyrinogen-III synthase [Burkholderiaceae bacterium]